MSKTLAESLSELSTMVEALGVTPDDSAALGRKARVLKDQGILTDREHTAVVAGLAALSAVMACRYGATGSTEVKGV